jgi:hypothetical protein
MKFIPALRIISSLSKLVEPPSTMPDIITSSQVPNDGNTSILPSFQLLIQMLSLPPVFASYPSPVNLWLYHWSFIRVVATNQRSYLQIEAIGGFSASKRSGIHLRRSSDCSSRWWWRGGQSHKNTRNLRKLAPTFIVAQQPEALWTNGDSRRIQRIKLVWTPPWKKFWL